MKKVRTAAVVAVATTAYKQAQEYARENPERAASALGAVESFLRDKAPPQYASKVDGGGAAIRRHFGLPARTAAPTTDGDAERLTERPAGSSDPSI